jgi:SsrA-binding protein
MPRNKNILQVHTNRKAFHEYFILETFDAGLELLGAEIKSLREKECSLEGAFVRIDKGEAWLLNMYIKPYVYNTHTALEPARMRKLLLNKREINKLTSAADIKGQTIVPLEVYIKNGWAKVKIAVAKGKKIYDKRETQKKKDLARESETVFKNKIKF